TIGWRGVAVTAVAVLVCSGCSKTDGAQARGRDDAAKRVKIEVVRQEAVHRAAEVVGTLAAVDEVTVSSQAEGTVSRVLADLDDADATLHAKQASYDSALQTAKNLRADIDATDAAAKLADRQLRDTYIRAPFDGFVQKRLVSLGELVKNQTPVMSVVRIDPLKVVAEIPERMAPWIRTGQPVELYVDAFPGRAIAGRVSRISPAVNAATRAFPFEALVPNGGAAALKPGTFARVR